MGRKMKGTKSGKFINPTDQARKEARKRELKKNKKQRLLVRTAVLKGKDPYQIIADLERLDKMEFDYSQSSVLNEKVLKDKRRKLKETWDRLCRLYVKDDRDRYLELKRLEAEYDAKRNELVKQFEAVKSAQEVSIDDIPLPEIPLETPSAPSTETSTTSILKSGGQQKKTPPGCPQGLPPRLDEFEIADDDDDGGESNDEEESNSPRKRIRFADDDAPPAADKQSNLKEFLKEIEQLADKTEQVGKELESDASLSDKDKVVPLAAAPGSAGPPPFPLPGSRPPPLQPAPPVSMLPPPPSLPPMPPSVTRPQVLPPPPPPFLGPPPPRLPLPPQSSDRSPMLPMHPPGGSSINMRLNSNLMHQQQQLPPQAPAAGAMFPSSSTSYSNYQRKPDERKSQVTTISAKPQLRNLSADSTRFMPLALRLNRQGTAPKKPPASVPKPIVGYGMVSGSSTTSTSFRPSAAASNNNSNNKDPKNSKDDAYVEFMKEMSGFM